MVFLRQCLKFLESQELDIHESCSSGHWGPHVAFHQGTLPSRTPSPVRIIIWVLGFRGAVGNSQFQAVLSAHDPRPSTFWGWKTCGGALCASPGAGTTRVLPQSEFWQAWLEPLQSVYTGSAHSRSERLHWEYFFRKRCFQESFCKTEVINILAFCLCFSPVAIFYTFFIVRKSVWLILKSIFYISLIISYFPPDNLNEKGYMKEGQKHFYKNAFL